MASVMQCGCGLRTHRLGKSPMPGIWFWSQGYDKIKLGTTVHFWTLATVHVSRLPTEIFPLLIWSDIVHFGGKPIPQQEAQGYLDELLITYG